jgi:uncharacterized cofD-like protein
VGEPGVAVRWVGIEPEGAVAPAAVIQAVERADAIVISPRSLFTSTIPALLGARLRRPGGVRRPGYLRRENMMTQPGETVGCTLSDHLVAIAEHGGPGGHRRAGAPGAAARALLSRYRAEGAAPVEVDREEIERLGVRVRTAPLLPDEIGSEARHDPERLRVPCSTWRLPERRRCVRLPEGSAAAVTGPALALRGGPSGPPP